VSTVLLPAPQPGLAALAWIDAGGVETVLHDLADLTPQGWHRRIVAAGARGLGMLPVSLRAQKVAGMPGARVREARHEPREIDLPIFWQDSSPAAIAARLAALFRAVDPLRGEGTLRAKNAAGEWRELACRYDGGLEGDTSSEARQRTWRRFVLSLRADDDPYWYDAAPVAEAFDRGAPRPFFRVGPIRVNTPALWRAVTRTNGGDVGAYPVWTIAGPCRRVGLYNLTTGLRLEVAATVGEGQVLTIDTRPRRRARVYLGDGTDLFAALTPESDLWPLAPGPNELHLSLVETGPGASVAYSYRRGYLGID
jgi:hypothetical protein